MHSRKLEDLNRSPRIPSIGGAAAMAKQKTPTPQELYRARKQKEEEERQALLPPGLINHGNTCFMNSVLQGVCSISLKGDRIITESSPQLIATRLLLDLVFFNPLPPSTKYSSDYFAPIDPRRSPLLTNGHGLAGKYDREWVEGMPLGDVFVRVMRRAWSIQHSRRREILSPKWVTYLCDDPMTLTVGLVTEQFSLALEGNMTNT
jgi:hypothetical protein